MLKITRSNSLNGTIEIEGVTVVHLSANMTLNKDNPNGYSSSGINRNVVNTELYKNNLSIVREEMRAFEAEAYAMEDELLSILTIE